MGNLGKRDKAIEFRNQHSRQKAIASRRIEILGTRSPLSFHLLRFRQNFHTINRDGDRMLELSREFAIFG